MNRSLLFILLTLSCLLGGAPAWAQESDTEDDSNDSPTIEVRVNSAASTTGMANRPGTGRPPSPVDYSSSYTPTVDRTSPPTIPSEPQPGFPGASPAVVAPGDTTLVQLFERAERGALRNCSIERSRNRRENCQYEVIVEGRLYPFHLTICSSNDSAATVGCNYGEERTNAACILQQAVAIGYCR